MISAVHLLNEGIRPALAAHCLALPVRDRGLRFCASIAPAFIKTYVDRIDFDHDAVFGVHDDRFVLIGVAHLAFEADLAELALSVLPAHRCRGVGTALFKQAVAYARGRGVPRLFMHCLSENAPIMRIARKSGMDIVASAADADAYLELQPAAMTSIAVEVDEPVELSATGRSRHCRDADHSGHACEL